MLLGQLEVPLHLPPLSEGVVYDNVQPLLHGKVSFPAAPCMCIRQIRRIELINSVLINKEVVSSEKSAAASEGKLSSQRGLATARDSAN
jgi:hypothetical protein